MMSTTKSARESIVAMLQKIRLMFFAVLLIGTAVLIISVVRKRGVPIAYAANFSTAFAAAASFIAPAMTP